MTGKKRKESLKWRNKETMGCFFLQGYGGCKGRIYRVDWDPQFTSAYTAFASQTMGIILFDQNQIYIILLLQHGLEHRERKQWGGGP